MADNRPELSDHEITKHVEALVKRSGTSFFWAMRRLPKEKRAAMYSVYAFCREVDDIVDDPGEESDKVFRLGMWRGEIERLYGDRPRFPVAMALVEPVHRFGLRKVDFRSVVDGMEMDAKDTVRIADMDELGHYCDRVAGAVGRLSFRIFGVDEERGNRIAFALGQALARLCSSPTSCVISSRMRTGIASTFRPICSRPMVSAGQMRMPCSPIPICRRCARSCTASPSAGSRRP